MATAAIPLPAPFALPDPPTEHALLAKYFRVLGDPTRLRILELLDERGELAVGELVVALAVSQPKVSNHLACLRWCGFVAARREHPRVLYRLEDPRVKQLMTLGSALLEENAEHVAACVHVDGSAA